jgi:hypothetical protein
LVKPKQREVRAEIGARPDNWDFDSSNPLVNALNPIIAAVFIDHYNLEAPLRINFVGPGKIDIVVRPQPTLPLSVR